MHQENIKTKEKKHIEEEKKDKDQEFCHATATYFPFLRIEDHMSQHTGC